MKSNNIGNKRRVGTKAAENGTHGKKRRKVSPHEKERRDRHRSQQNDQQGGHVETASPPPGHKGRRRVAAQVSGADEAALGTDPVSSSSCSSALTLLDRLRDPTSAIDALRQIANENEDQEESSSAASLFERQFLSQGGQAQDLLRVLNGREKPKANEVICVFHACQTVFAEVARTGKNRDFALRLALELLQNHLRHIMLMLSPTNTAMQAKSTLDLLSSMCVSDLSVAREMLNKIDLEHDNFQSCARRRAKEVSSLDGSGSGGGGGDVRTKYIHFLLSFLFASSAGGQGSSSLAKEFLEKKSKIGQIFPGLDLDSCSTVTLVLGTIKSRVLESDGVSKTAKMKLLSAAALKAIVKLLQWRGPRHKVLDDPSALGPEEVKLHLTESATVTAAAADFLQTALTSHKHGIIFKDPSVGTSGQSRNHLLLSLLRSLERPWERSQESELVTRSLAACPDQLRPYLATMEKFWQPRAESQSWIQICDFLHSIMSAQELARSVAHLNKDNNKESSSLLPTVVANLAVPVSLFREVVLASLSNENAAVKAKGAELGALILRKAETFLNTNCDSQQKLKVLEKLSDRLPKPQLLTQLWSGLNQDTAPETISHIATIVNFFLSSFPDRFAQHLDPSNLIQDLEGLSLDQEDLLKIRARLIKSLFSCSGRQVKEEDLRELLKLSVGQCEARATLKTFLVSKHFVKAEQDYEVDAWMKHLESDDDLRNVGKALIDSISKGFDETDKVAGEFQESVPGWNRSNHVLKTSSQDLIEMKPTRLTVVLASKLPTNKSYLNESLIQLFASVNFPFALCKFVLGQKKGLKEAKRVAKEVLDYDLKSLDIPPKRLDEVKRNCILHAVRKDAIAKIDPSQIPDTFSHGQREVILQAVLDRAEADDHSTVKVWIAKLLRDLSDANKTKLSSSLLRIRDLVPRLSGLVQEGSEDSALMMSLVQRYDGLLDHDLKLNEGTDGMIDGDEDQVDEIADKIVHAWKEVSSCVKNHEDKEKLGLAAASLLGHLTSFDRLEKDEISSGDFEKLSKTLLKHGLQPKMPKDCRSRSLTCLNSLCQKVSLTEDQVDVLANLVLGHSGCAVTLFDQNDRHSGAKAAVLALLANLAGRSKRWMRQQMVADILGCYHGTLSSSDRAALRLLSLLDKNNNDNDKGGCGWLSDFSPVMWGDAAISHYAGGGGRAKSLWRVPRASEILGLIDSDKMLRSAARFPLDLSLDPQEQDEQQQDLDDKDRYDPRFFLPLLSQLCSPGAFVDRHLRLVESGGAALAMAAMASRCKDVRMAGYRVMARIYKSLDGAKLTSEKKVWLHLVDLVRNGVRNSGSKNITSLRVPSLVSVFLIRCCSVLQSPADPMFKAVSSFVLAKPTMDLFRIPEFLRLFHGASPLDRRWLLKVLRDGMRDGLDFSVARKDHAVKALLSFHDSALGRQDHEAQTLIRQVLHRCALIPSAAFDLVFRRGLLHWVRHRLTATTTRTTTRDGDDEASQLMNVLDAAWESMTDKSRLPYWKKNRKNKEESCESDSEDSEEDEDEEMDDDDDDGGRVEAQTDKNKSGRDASLLRTCVEFDSAVDAFIRFSDCNENHDVMERALKAKAKINKLRRNLKNV